MFTFTTALKTALDSAPNQAAVNAKLNEMLTETRTLSLTKDGVAFYSATMGGQIVMLRNTITNYGYVTAESVATGANLLTGVCKLRISGGGHYVEGDLGLTAAAQTAAGITTPIIRDFMLSANPTPNNGIGFARYVKTKLPVKPNGIGPSAPTLDANVPKRLEIYSVVNGVEALVDFLEFDTPDENLLFADSEIAGQMGETKVVKSSKTIVFDKFRFGAKFYASSATNSADGVTPLYRVLVACQPYNQGWDSYPAERNWPSTTVYMHPPAFRAKLKKADGSILHVWQGRDGTPINDPSWSQVWDATHALRPFWHCAAMLPWQNVRARTSDLKNKFYSGVEADFIRPSLAKRIYTANGTEPYLDGYTNLDGYNHMYQIDQWPKATGSTEDQPLDAFNQPLASNGNHSYFQQVNGWSYEPGSKSGHEYQTGPGGVRFDRSVIPSLYALWATNPNGRRLKGNVLYQDMFDAHALAFFNHPMFYFRDVQNFTGIPDNEIVRDGGCLWNQRGAYYGGTGGKGPDFTVDMRGVNAGASTSSGALSGNRDLKGNLYWNGYLPDFLHGYHNPGWAALLTNDPIFAIAAKHNYNALSLAQLDEQTDPHNDYQYFGNRQYAWRLVNRTMAWKLASGNEAGHDRAQLENMMRVGLESIYDNWYIPTYEKPITEPRYKLMKALGVTTADDGSRYSLNGAGLMYYLADTVILMKQTGLWSIMRKKNYKCEKALWFIINSMDIAGIDQLLDTPGTWESRAGSGYFEAALASNGTKVTLEDCPSSWADWKIKVFDVLDPNRVNADWVTEENGTLAERHESMHMRGGWVLNRVIYFPEYINPRAQAAYNKVMAYYDKVRLALPAAANYTRTQNDFAYLTPAKGKRLPPSTLGDE
jgi:hypothetical protein